VPSCIETVLGVPARRGITRAVEQQMDAIVIGDHALHEVRDRCQRPEVEVPNLEVGVGIRVEDVCSRRLGLAETPRARMIPQPRSARNADGVTPK